VELELAELLEPPLRPHGSSRQYFVVAPMQIWSQALLQQYGSAAQTFDEQPSQLGFSGPPSVHTSWLHDGTGEPPPEPDEDAELLLTPTLTAVLADVTEVEVLEATLTVTGSPPAPLVALTLTEVCGSAPPAVEVPVVVTATLATEAVPPVPPPAPATRLVVGSLQVSSLELPLLPWAQAAASSIVEEAKASVVAWRMGTP
jgi:hypothetical protein